jgi:hypothetical protein
VDNYFNYFTEIEERFQQRRGGGLLLSTLDWALIETWKDAGIPLEAVLRGIDAAFDHYDQRPSKAKKVNSLAYCSQEVLTAAEDMKEAAVGVSKETSADAAEPGPSRQGPESQGFERKEIAAFLRRNALALDAVKLPAAGGLSAGPVIAETSSSLRRLADELESAPGDKSSRRLEDLERRLTVMEEKVLAVLLASTPDEELVAVRTEADRDLAPYRRKMPSAQIAQLHRQYVHKRMLEQHGLPRLSLFYL